MSWWNTIIIFCKLHSLWRRIVTCWLVVWCFYETRSCYTVSFYETCETNLRNPIIWQMIWITKVCIISSILKWMVWKRKLEKDENQTRKKVVILFWNRKENLFPRKSRFSIINNKLYNILYWWIQRKWLKVRKKT